MFRSASTVASLCAAITLTACGDDDTTSRSSDAAKAPVRRFFAGIAESDGKLACSALTGAAQRDIVKHLDVWTTLFGGEFRTCEEVIESSFNFSEDERDRARQVRVRRIRISGARATLADDDIQVPEGQEFDGADNGRPAVLRYTNDGWKIEDLG